ncbi:MAG: hypothetical protein KIS61_34230 [Candidatus Eremiobacteraeota bacterium]|nr:hypothetical protein [Candidatus Eremiobacteraeota bacterium]
MGNRGWRQGLSLLEVQVSLLLLLLVCLYLMSLFASGQRHARRSIDYSKCTMLAHRRLEEAKTVPFEELATGLRQETDPNPGFNTTLSLTPYEDGLYVLQVEAVAPSGALARAFCLTSDPAIAFSGVISDEYSHKVVWVNGTDLMGWDDQTSTVTNLGAVSDARRGGALAGRPGTNFFWRGGSKESPVSYRETLPAPGTWGAALAAPVAAVDSQRALALFSGMATDQGTGRLVAADLTNRGLWFSDGSAWNSTSVSKPQNPPLGRPAGIVCDPAMSLIWVADVDYQCLRKLVSPEASAHYSPTELESAGPLGNWHRRRFRPPASLGLGSPIGLAMDSHGWAVYVHDRARLYRFVDSTGEWSLLGTLDENLRQDLPSGMTTDRYGSLFFLTTERGSLWKIRPPAGLTPMTVTKLWP